MSSDPCLDLRLIPFRTELGEGLDERAAAEITAFDRQLQCVKERQDSFQGRLGGLAGNCAKELLPALLFLCEIRSNQPCLGREMPVESHLGNPACSDDPIYAHG